MRMSRPVLALLFFCSLAATTARGQFRPASPEATLGGAELVLQSRLTESFQRTVAAPIIEDPSTPSVKKKNGFLAALLSAAIPGLGEYYVGDQIWRGAIFTALEGGLIYGMLRWDSRGDDSTVIFQQFADAHWSPARYGSYLDSILNASGRGDIIMDPSNLTEINNAEDTLSRIAPLLGIALPLSHRLPQHGAQQYYELISKYQQYTVGWDDATNPLDPKSSGHYQTHADMRERMNYQFEVRDYFTFGIILNHALSAIDAALLAKDHNSQIRVQGELLQRRYPNGEMGYIPSARVQLRI